MKKSDSTASERAGEIIFIVISLSILLAALLVAWRNLRQGKGDRHGAFRIGGVIFACNMALWLCRSHLTFNPSLFGLFILAVSTSLFWAGAIWLLYLALEPYVRRHWPHSIISWSRLTADGWRDPVLGRDVLFGVILGLVWAFIFDVRALILMHQGGAPEGGNPDFLMGIRTALGAWLTHVPGSVRTTLVFFFVLFLLKVLLRKTWLAVPVFVAIWTAQPTLASDHPLISGPLYVLVYIVAALTVLRFGLVTLAVGAFTVETLFSVPLTFDLSAWYAGSMIWVLLSIMALAGWGFYTSLAGQRLLKEDLFQ